MMLEEYAKKILADHGCDEYTYGNESRSEQVLEDLKKGYPGGMEFPYIDVANAILAMSRPKPIVRKPWSMVWETESDCDGVGCGSFESAKALAEDLLVEWQVDKMSCYPIDLKDWTEEQIEDWDYMIYNYGTEIRKYNPDTDEYDSYPYFPTYEFEKEIGWMLYEDLIKEGVTP